MPSMEESIEVFEQMAEMANVATGQNFTKHKCGFSGLPGMRRIRL